MADRAARVDSCCGREDAADDGSAGGYNDDDASVVVTDEEELYQLRDAVRTRCCTPLMNTDQPAAAAAPAAAAVNDSVDDVKRSQFLIVVQRHLPTGTASDIMRLPSLCVMFSPHDVALSRNSGARFTKKNLRKNPKFSVSFFLSLS